MESLKENKMGTKPVWSLLLGMALPVMLSGAAAAFTLSGPYLHMMTGDPVIYEAGLQYIRICMGLAIMPMGQLVFERMLIATGKTSLSMISQGAGGILNLILDPVLIFGLGPFPAMGISGAAAATVFSQAVAMTLAFTLNLRKNHDVHIRLVKPAAAVLRRLLFLGAPTAVIMSLNSVMMVNFNAVLNQFSTTAVAVFGACRRTTGFFYALLNAMCSATIPIIAYNHGARNKRRIDHLRLFNATDEMIEIGVWGMRMLCCCYVFCAVRNMSGCILQALGRSVASTATDLTRNYAILIPFAWIFSLTGSLDAVWLSIPLADVVSAAAGFLLMLRAYKRDIRPMDQTELSQDLH